MERVNKAGLQTPAGASILISSFPWSDDATIKKQLHQAAPRMVIEH